MSTNDITGDKIATRVTSEAYRNNYDAIFGKKKVDKENESSTTDVKSEFINPENQSPFNTINS